MPVKRDSTGLEVPVGWERCTETRTAPLERWALRDNHETEERVYRIATTKQRPPRTCDS